MTPIVVCTVTGVPLPILEASVRAYCPDVDLLVYSPKLPTSGESFNFSLNEVFKSHDEVIITGDDVVVSPGSYQNLMEDVERLKLIHGDKLGFVASISNIIRSDQDIRFVSQKDAFPIKVISPLFAWISKKAFNVANFPPIDWFSDDVMSLDLTMAGFTHYVSPRSYVHHAGSQTIGHDVTSMYLKSIRWMEENRPDIVSIFKR